MTKKYQLSIFIFRRDLRIFDNTALNKALELSDSVLPCFIFDPEQVTKKNRFRSLPALQFMCESLTDLKTQIKKEHGQLLVRSGDPVSVLKDIIKKYNAQAVFINRDYTPFSIARDDKISELCENLGVDFHAYHDLLLINPDKLKTKTATPYRMFTPFFKAAQQLVISKPHTFTHGTFFIDAHETPVNADLDNLFTKKLLISGGRKQGLKILKNLKKFKDYKKTRDYPEIQTTHLSAHNKFGTVSVREVYWAIADQLGVHHELIRALYWRDFFTYIGYHFPQVFGHAFKKQYDQLQWSTDRERFAAWCAGRTGFPLVDAGMRELNATGFMHNRVRLITASFLVKDLHSNWLWGERYFAQKLIDYDPAVNNGNWQWVASTGTDAQPYFRIFNPWLQQKKYDPDCAYIKKWIPELRMCTPSEIHRWYKQKKACNNYPAPLVIHEIEAQKAKSWYKKAAHRISSQWL